jgi:hypothetical protein
MNTINQKPPIRIKHHSSKRKLENNTSNVVTSDFAIEEVEPNLFLSSSSSAKFTTFNGFFGEEPKQLTLTYELCKAYAKMFMEVAQYLWGPASTASLLKTIKELQTIKEYGLENGQNEQQHSSKEEEEKSLKDLLQKTSQELILELQHREIIQNRMFVGSMISIVE